MDPSDSKRRPLVAIALTWAAGYVDAFGYLLLGGVYTATMSGNTVLIGVHGIAGDHRTAFLHALTVGAFVLGLVVSGAVIKLGQRRGVRRTLAFAMGLEALCLAGLLLGTGRLLQPGSGAAADPMWQPPLYLLVGIAAVAMGIQNTSLRMAGVLTVYTTHVTGALTRFGEDAVEYLFGRRARAGALSGAADSGAAGPEREVRLGTVLFSSALWGAFLIGAIAAAYATSRIGPLALLPAIAVVLAVGGVDCVAPFGRPHRR